MVTSSRGHQGRSGPRRREYQRAAYRVRRITETGQDHHYPDAHRHDRAGDSHRWNEIIACGTQMYEDADALAAAEILAAGVERPHVDVREVTRTRTMLTKARADWLYIHEETRTQFPDAAALTDSAWACLE